MSKSKSKNEEKALIPEIGDFSQFFKNRSKFSQQMTDVISNVYEWSSSLDPQADDALPLPFVSKNEEVVWSYLKHQNKQLDGLNRKFKGFLSELIGKQHIRLSAKREHSEDSEGSEDVDNEEEMDLEDVDDEEEDVDDEEEEEGDADLFNLSESDLKTLDADLKKMAEDEEEEEDSEGADVEEKKKTFKKSIVDDEFFSLEEMHDYLKKTERGHGKGVKQRHEEEMMFEDEDSWDGKTDYIYEDFFGTRDAVTAADSGDTEEAAKKMKKKTTTGEKKRKAGEADLSSADEGKNAKKRVRFAMDEQEEEEEDVDDEEMEDEEEDVDDISDRPVLLGADLEDVKEESGFAKRQQKMKERIAKLEEENLAPKSWELSGEVAADQRDQNTLLEKHVDFDHGAKRAPEVTEEFTDRLESLIKQRIKDKAWDDVVRVKKVEAKGARFETEAIENVMNQKTSLAEVYEKEYQKAGEGAGADGEKKENPAHEQVKQKMADLFRLIDALTHFEYKPDQSRDEVRVVSNMAALRVEEVGQTASTEAQLLAPEEVTKKMRALEKGKEERTATDKARERRQKKAKQRSMLEKFGEERVFGEQKAAKKAKAERGKETKTEKVKSSNFFAKLQETVQAEKKVGGAVTKKKKVVKREKSTKNSAAIKL